MARCRYCKEKYEPTRPMQPCCDKFECKSAFMAEHIGKARARRQSEERKKAREERKELRRRKEEAKPLSYWADRAQKAVNAYRRELMKDEPCISCGRHHQGQYHAGHYINRGSHPELRFNEVNIWKQCKPCNVDLSGNKIEFRKALAARIGLEKVEWLEGPHPQAKYTRADYQQIETAYTRKRKELIG